MIENVSGRKETKGNKKTRPTQTQFPTSSLQTPMDGPLVYSIPCVWCSIDCAVAAETWHLQMNQGTIQIVAGFFAHRHSQYCYSHTNHTVDSTPFHFIPVVEPRRARGNKNRKLWAQLSCLFGSELSKFYYDRLRSLKTVKLDASSPKRGASAAIWCTASTTI